MGAQGGLLRGFFTSSLPAPTCSAIGVGMRFSCVLSALIISAVVSVRVWWRSRAAAPVTCGAAMLVPLFFVVLGLHVIRCSKSLMAAVMPSAGASRSGFTGV